MIALRLNQSSRHTPCAVTRSRHTECAYYFALLALLLLAPCARAQLDPGTKEPYQIQVVLQVASSRVFTPLFQEQLQRDVQNQLRIGFGALARVEVVRTHPLLREIESKGLDAALEGQDAVSEIATHFVLLDYIAGTYRLQARAHDGLTGQAAPVTVTRTTADRTAVASTIAQMIEASFSPVGTVSSVGKKVALKFKVGGVAGKEVTIKLRAGELGSLERWVERGHVLAVSQIRAEAGKPRATGVEWALLEVLDTPKTSECRCVYWHRYQQDALDAGAGVLGYRAVRLPTVKGPARIQLLDDKTLKPLDGVRVHLQRLEADAKPEERNPSRDGIVVSNASFAHLAWVQVLAGERTLAQFPVPLLEGRTSTARVQTQAGAEARAPLDARRDAWLRRTFEQTRLGSDRALELSRLLNQSLEAARDSARKALPLLDAEIKYLDAEQDEVERLAKEKLMAYKLQEGKQQIDELRKQSRELQAFIGRIDSVLKEAGGEKTLGLAKIVERARLLESEADFAQALRLYDQVVQASPEQTTVTAHRDRLRDAWALRGEKHEAARKFTYDVWPTLDVPGLQKEIKNASEHLAACKAAGDRLTPQRLLRANVVHTVSLKQQLEALKRRDTEDNRNQAADIVRLSEALLALHNDASAFVAARKSD